MTDLYKQEDIQQILQIAIARQVESDLITRSQLLEIADELGISSGDLQIAEQEWKLQQGESQERHSFQLHRRSKLYQRVTRFAIVTAFLLIFGIIVFSNVQWTLPVILIWGLFLALDAWRTFQTKGEAFEDAFQRWRQRRLLKRSVGNLLNRWLGAR